MFKLFYLLLISSFLTGCAVYQPNNTNNICSIFQGDTEWYEAAKDAEDNWGTPIPAMMAIMHQESRFIAQAQPKRKWFLWIIPLPRASSAFGYAQAQDPIWSEYTRDGHRFHSRDDFSDSINFIGWYMHGSHKTIGIKKSDVYSQYLAYHEGRGGFKRKTYNKKPWLKKVASKVKRQSIRYSSQLKKCKSKLDKATNSWFF